MKTIVLLIKNNNLHIVNGKLIAIETNNPELVEEQLMRNRSAQDFYTKRIIKYDEDNLAKK
jgi:hypothetical protein